MAILVIAAAALLIGLDWRLAALGVAVMVAPWMVAAVVGLWIVRSLLVRPDRNSGPEAEVAFHTAVAVERSPSRPADPGPARCQRFPK